MCTDPYEEHRQEDEGNVVDDVIEPAAIDSGRKLLHVPSARLYATTQSEKQFVFIFEGSLWKSVAILR